MADFKAGTVQCLVATDIAARGLDIDQLSHVFNYNLSEVPETYVHRIGRTGRAGRDGQAIAFCDFGEQSMLKEIEKLTGRKVTVVEDHPFPMQVFEAPKKDKRGRVINEEDAEARAAAREKRRTRDEAQKAAAKEKRQAEQAKAQEDRKALEESQPAAPAKSRRRKKKKAEPQMEQSIPTPIVAVETAPARRSRPKMTRPGTRMETGDAMPQTDFYRPDPLSGEHIMDATARLLAPRRTSLTASRPTPAQDSPRPKDKKRKKASAPTQPAPVVETAPEPQAPAKRKKKPRKAEPQQPAVPTQSKGSPSKGNKRHDRAPRGPVAPMKSGQTKDSTEQKSLMKPYYLNF